MTIEQDNRERVNLALTRLQMAEPDLYETLATAIANMRQQLEALLPMTRQLRAVKEYNDSFLDGGDLILRDIVRGDDVAITEILGENPDGSPAHLDDSWTDDYDTEGCPLRREVGRG